MSNAEESPRDLDHNEEDAEIEDLEIAKEEADAVSGGAVSSDSPSGKRFGA